MKRGQPDDICKYVFVENDCSCVYKKKVTVPVYIRKQYKNVLIYTGTEYVTWK